MRPPRPSLLSFSAAHLRDCLAIALVASPLYAWLEVQLLGLPPATSARIRLMTLVALVAGLGLVLARGRDLSQRVCAVVPGRSPERVVLLHDMAYMALANGVLAPLFYLAGGASLAAALQGSGMAVVLSFLTGSLNGWSIDALRELSGGARTRRLPAALRQQPAAARYGAAGALVAGSALLVLAAYR